ncbi:MAG: tetratricopeptide repeat protein [Pseudomonadota bacterium]
MARSDQSPIQAEASKTARSRQFGLLVGTAIASMALAGCTSSAPPAEVSFAKAQSALQDGKTDRAIQHGEEAVLADPRNASYRATLGAAYLEAGRYESAATAFGEALDLGDSDPRTVLSFALAKVATGDRPAALAELYRNDDRIPAADLGLALALAGQPERGVQFLVNAVRDGEATAKTRQNLAYAYALAGNWRAARVMAAEDVPADQLDARLSDWAAMARPEDYQKRVASLLGIPVASDGGQPQYLALANFPSQPELVADAAQFADAEPVEAEFEQAPVMVAAVANEPENTSVPAVQPAVRENQMAFGIADIDTIGTDSEGEVSAPAAPAPASVEVPAIAAAPSRSVSRAAPSATPRFVSNPVVQEVPAVAQRAESRPVPAARPAGGSSQARMAIATGASATHLVQLGSFDSRAVAESKWSEFQRRFAGLRGRDVVITEARVNGRTFFRVAAAGFGANTARNMCSTLKAGGASCFAYAASTPPAGAVDRGTRIAARGE